MSTTTLVAALREEDQRVFLHDVSWKHYEMILATRGESPGVRITYLDGELELMSPSREHEGINRFIGRLLEAFAEEHGLDLNCFGSWTVRKMPKKAGVEPDTCYVLGTERKKRPDLAIEVIWTSGGIDKLEVYARLGVPEVWFWEEGAIASYVLRGDCYARARRSRLFREVDLGCLASFLDRPSQTQAVREYRALLRARPRKPNGR